jgi:hypothetical protein
MLKDTMRLVKLEYGRVDKVSYWVDIALGQGEFPRDLSLSHVKWIKMLGSTLNGHRAHYIQGVLVSHSWVPLWRVCGTFVRNAIFPSPSIAFYLSFFVFFSIYHKERLKATTMAW